MLHWKIALNFAFVNISWYQNHKDNVKQSFCGNIVLFKSCMIISYRKKGGDAT